MSRSPIYGALPGAETLDRLVNSLARDPESGIDFVAIIDGRDGHMNIENAEWGSAVATQKVRHARVKLRERLGSQHIEDTRIELLHQLAPYAHQEDAPLGSTQVSMRSALSALAAGAETFQRSMIALKEKRFGPDELYSLSSAADGIATIVERRLDLAVRAHRIRTQTKSQLSVGALHATSIALITTIIANMLELHPELQRTLSRLALVVHLPYASSGRPPSPALVGDTEASAYCQKTFENWSKFKPSEGPKIWWEGAWSVAYEHRLGLRLEDDTPTSSVARLVAVAAAFDAMVAPGFAPMSTRCALKTLARNIDLAFDLTFVTALASVLSAH